MKCLSFFSGCLGLDTGLEISGIKHLLFCENDKNAANSIRLNKPSVPLIEDILNFDSKFAHSLTTKTTSVFTLTQRKCKVSDTHKVLLQW